MISEYIILMKHRRSTYLKECKTFLDHQPMDWIVKSKVKSLVKASYTHLQLSEHTGTIEKVLTSALARVAEDRCPPHVRWFALNNCGGTRDPTRSTVPCSISAHAHTLHHKLDFGDV
jgi:hypothetical protein